MSDKVMQSYVWHKDKCFFISTINRESSAALASELIYAETLIWECDPNTFERGDLIGQGEGLEGSILKHLSMCQELHDNGKLNDAS